MESSGKRKPKLGQHFLADAAYRQRIIELLRLDSGDLVIEIGPGRGAMTSLLAERAHRVVAVEVDPRLAQLLGQQLGSNSKIEVREADILTVDLEAVCHQHQAEKCFVFGNLPYYITSPILHHVFAYVRRIRAMSLLVQREVAARLTAVPGTRDYGYLTVLVNLWSEVEVRLTVPPGAFAPPPKVYSSLVDFTIKPQFPDWSSGRVQSFLEFVKLSFAQKRKTLANNLLRHYERSQVEAAISRCGIASTVRTEELTLRDLAILYEHLAGTSRFYWCET
jgi:16S rRNA (adenine1518-N6/adenine1519-N6)-dimethyltransferase